MTAPTVYRRLIVAVLLVGAVVLTPASGAQTATATCRHDAEAKTYGYAYCVQQRPTNTFPASGAQTQTPARCANHYEARLQGGSYCEGPAGYVR